MQRLPRTAQDIADVIGRDAALRLIGQLPRCSPSGHSEIVMLYVPKDLRPDHRLVRLIGWDAANRLVNAFGGEVLLPANCAGIYRAFRDRSIARLKAEHDLPVKVLAEWFEVSDRHVRNVLRKENPQVGRSTPANQNRPAETEGRTA